ncbi:MAG: glutamate racemase [Comamonadaceae bacterium]|nr:MAG: glutamate racemase [Comamonadaceae bacterium]
MSILSQADAPIAIFDSGLGGLSVARHIRARLPHESLIYFADCGWAPYGDRPRQDILARVCVVADWLVTQGVKSMVVACNTATTIAIDTLRARYDTLPIVGIEPGVKPAVARSRSHVVGVLATEATLRTESFQALLARQDSDCRFVCQAGRGLVALIEQGALDTPAVDTLLQRYLDPMLAEGVDTLVLGSTHFPLLIPAIERLYGDRLALIETGQAVAHRLHAVLDMHALLAVASEAKAVQVRLVSSRPSPALLVLAGRTLGTTSPLQIALD